jgi:hypothetical protein
VGLERGPLSLVSTTEELLGRKGRGSGLENRDYGLGIRHVDHVAPCIRNKFELSSPTSGGRSVGIVLSRTQAMEFVLFCFVCLSPSQAVEAYGIVRCRVQCIVTKNLCHCL